MGKISNTMAFDENDPPKKKSPTKKSKLHSPSRGSKQRLQSSPSMKNKVNLNKTQEEIEDSSNFVLTSGIHLNFDEENEDPSQTKCEQVNLDFGQFQKEEMTLEGISGMVHMENSNLIQNQIGDTIGDMFDNSQNCSSDGVEAPTAFDAQVAGSESQPLNLEHTISIDSNGLDDLSKKANIQDIIEQNKVKEIEKEEFDSEIMSIIGSINSRH